MRILCDDRHRAMLDYRHHRCITMLPKWGASIIEFQCDQAFGISEYTQYNWMRIDH